MTKREITLNVFNRLRIEQGLPELSDLLPATTAPGCYSDARWTHHCPTAENLKALGIKIGTSTQGVYFPLHALRTANRISPVEHETIKIFVSEVDSGKHPDLVPGTPEFEAKETQMPEHDQYTTARIAALKHNGAIAALRAEALVIRQAQAQRLNRPVGPGNGKINYETAEKQLARAAAFDGEADRMEADRPAGAAGLAS